MPHPLSGSSTVLADANNIVIMPLYAITTIYTTLTMCFTTWDFDPETREEHEICCFRFSELPWYIDPRPKVPILFEVIGQIALEDCFLTIDGYESPESSGQDDERLATCWIETRPDYISQIYWSGVAPAVEEIRSHIPTDVDTSRLIGEDEGGVRLQVCYQPPAGQSIVSTLPFYNVRREREVPSCIGEVPFGQPVRVAFALESRYCRDDPMGERILVAVLEHMALI